jgi:hypothetical protein
MWVTWLEPWRCPGCGHMVRFAGWPKAGELPKSGNVTCTAKKSTEGETAPISFVDKFIVQAWADGWYGVARVQCDPPLVCMLKFDRKDGVTSL